MRVLSCEKVKSSRDRFFVNSTNNYQYNGFADDAMRYIEEFQLLQPALWKRFVQQFREDADFDAGWRGEYWGKMMRGACFVYCYTRNEALYEILSQTVSDMIDSADENGRISSYAVSHEFDGWDIWCRKYVLLGMLYFHEICKDNVLADKIVESMCRQVNYIMSKIGRVEDGKKPITSATRHWRGLNSSSLLDPIMRLYFLTKNRRYLEFAKYIVESGGTDIVNIFDLAYENELYPYQYPVTKAYEMMSCFEGLLKYYKITGEEKYRTAVINFADRILESDFTIIGCCGCTHELFDHSTVRQANTTNGDIQQETCVTVTLMSFFCELNLLTGNPKYIDAFEISFYNAYLGAINTEKVVKPAEADGMSECILEPLPFDSYSPLTSGQRGSGVGGLKVMSDRHYYGCCACIGAAGIGLIPKIQLLENENGFVLNLFINGTIYTQTPEGNPINFNIETKYPRDGRVRMTIMMEEPEKFEILVHNPGWSRTTAVKVNGGSMDVCAGYIPIHRRWKQGDVVEIELDMRTEALYPISYKSQILMNKVIWGKNYVIPQYDKEDPIAKNHIALRKGPVILAQDNRLGYSVDDPVEILVGDDGYVDAVLCDEKTSPYACMVEMQIPLQDGESMLVTDYASAGKLWTEESKIAAWMLTKHPGRIEA